MRKRLAALAVAALASLRLAACSDDETPTEPSASQPSKESGEASAAGGLRTSGGHRGR
ncbi:hypothetical protein ACN4DJ_04710 [Corynebacterium macclintockiae]|uniref:hypothetical protein n=1 Tax=Corynebacterium macclintockiae TaxID=2913501 RepID=UPI0025FE6552|nr:hypothetical protein [uncultured Corynebacterium sp.]